MVHHVSRRIGVMYLGRLVELGPGGDVFHRPLHPYTKLLISAVPRPDPGHKRRVVVEGEIPGPSMCRRAACFIRAVPMHRTGAAGKSPLWRKGAAGGTSPATLWRRRVMMKRILAAIGLGLLFGGLLGAAGPRPVLIR